MMVTSRCPLWILDIVKELLRYINSHTSEVQTVQTQQRFDVKVPQ